jgi:hypothetical protein
MPTLAELLREKVDALINLPSEAQRFITNPQAFTQLVTGKNPLPKETGFVAGATGLPAKNPVQGGVLNPASAPYQEGYEQGEPVAIAAMAVPAYATALRAGAPKAYNALENYMVKSGGMIPLEAYHGTPHKIEGAFDINKVGTGASANNFGHGIYFAESPDIASAFMASRSKISSPTEGNLYKVDIPDAQIPHMLDWYKPLAEQTPEVQAAIQKLGNKFRPLDELEAGNVTGERLYRRIENSLGKFYGNAANPEASKMLNDVGIKGIKYENMQMVRGQGVGTNNYVVFDPSEVKILNKYENKLNRKELIQDQIDKLE